MDLKILYKSIGIALFLMLHSCFPMYMQPTENENNANNVASIYNPFIISIHPLYHVFRTNETTTLITAKVHKSEILFNNANSEKIEKGKVLFNLYLYKIANDSRTLVDTLEFKYDVQLKSYENIFFAQMPIKTEPQFKYSLHIVYTDLLKQKMAIAFIDIDEATKNTGQNYLVAQNNQSFPAFKNYFNKNDYFNIRENFLQDSTMFIELYGLQKSLPRPPASITEPPKEILTADTVFDIELNDKMIFSQALNGMYRYSKDTSTNNGLTLFTFENKDYPRIKNSMVMLEPLRYIVSDQEYLKLSQVTNQKYALDRFWLSIAGGDYEKARQLIKIYYTRVMFANNYFISYTEGWRTDRGMIYIIYGPPKVIQKNDLKEKWIYGNTRSTNALAFTFYKRDHEFTNNHFELLRNNIYSMSWRNAVKAWRAGNAYSGEQTLSN